ncbi:MAG: hypothetical protein H7325_00010 [Pedobacter sp.]|nr:hypothetical protein [Pedobacter sp.]
MIIPNKTYKASLGTTSKLITLAITLLFIGIVVSQFIWFKEAHAAIFLVPLFIGLYVCCVLLMPLGYKVTDSEILVERIFSKVHFKKENIKSLQLIGRHNFAGSVRTFGNGGFFGFTGYFANDSIGRMTWFVKGKIRLYSSIF